MPDLIQSLQGRDLGHLRIIAELWGLDFTAPDARVGLSRLASSLVSRELLKEVVEALPENSRRALNELLKNGGRISWALFTRRYGQVREMGAAKRDRERPYLNQSANTTETLWYRALIAAGFFDTPNGPLEFAYVPEDLLPLLPGETGGIEPQFVGRPATPKERVFILPATDSILDDACTLLAGIRMGLSSDKTGEQFICAKHSRFPLTIEALRRILRSAGLILQDGSPDLEASRSFLEAGRAEALLWLFKSWLGSADFNELRLIPGISAEGEWSNDPITTRRIILDYLSTIPGSYDQDREDIGNPFWSLNAFVSAVRQNQPDFQRPAGDYDSWYLRDLESGEYLRGYEHWDEVDGELLRFMIAGPLHWLGILELGFPITPQERSLPEPTAFRFSPWAVDLLNLTAPKGLREEDTELTVSSDGRIRIPLYASRAVRYQMARFSEWEGISREEYIYRLTPKSLELSRQQGLKVQHLLSLLHRHVRALPPSLVSALERWELRGSETHFDRPILLRVKDPEIIQTLRRSRASRYLGESLSPHVIIIQAEAWEKVASVLLEMGYLSEVRF